MRPSWGQPRSWCAPALCQFAPSASRCPGGRMKRPRREGRGHTNEDPTRRSRWARPAAIRLACFLCLSVDLVASVPCAVLVPLPSGSLKGYCRRHWDLWPRSADLPRTTAAEVWALLVIAYGAEALG